MSVVVTGVTGHLGRLVVESLLNRGVPASEIVATGRRIETIADLAERGVDVRRADYSDADSLRAAFAGADKLLLVSGNELGLRVAQHQTAVAVAKESGVGLIAYTSIANADKGTTIVAGDHYRTEQAVTASGVPYVLLRNSWYFENYTAVLPAYLQHGIAGAAGDGRVSAAARADFAEAAAAVLAGSGPANVIYELGGPAFSMPELAEVVSDVTGQTVRYADLPVEQYQAVLLGAGLPEPLAELFADADRGLSRGELYVEGNELEKLVGRPLTPLADAVASAYAALQT